VLTYDTRVGQVLTRKINEQVEFLKESLTIGHSDLGHYRQMCGRILGLREASELIGEAIAEIEGRKTDQQTI